MAYCIWQAISIRKSHPALYSGTETLVNCGSPAVAAYLREVSQEYVLVIQSLCAAGQHIAWSLPGYIQRKNIDLLTGQVVDEIHGKASLSLQPYEYGWFLIK